MAGRIPEDKLDEVRQAADIVDVVGRRVRLMKAGRAFKGVCPFHGDTDPSLSVNPDRGTWYCFGCHEGGNAFSFVMRDEGLSFPEAVRELARRYGVLLPEADQTPGQRDRDRERERILDILETAAAHFREQLEGPEGGPARSYLLENRGLSPETVAGFGLGFAPDSWEGLRRRLTGRGVPEELSVKAGLLVPREKGSGSYDRFRGRVIFPIRNAGGRVVSFGGRIMGPGEPKYLNGAESPVFLKSKVLYNLDRARPAMRRTGRAIVVEGYFDVVSLAQAGFPEAVAPMGTALTQDQARRLAGQAGDVILVFDGDEAGRRAAHKSLPVFLAEGVSPRALLLPPGEDPDTFVKSAGPEAFGRALDQCRPLVETVLEEIIAEEDTGTPEGKSRVVTRAGEVLTAIKDPVAAYGYLKRLAEDLALPEELVAKRLGLPLPSRQRPAPQRARAGVSPQAHRQRQEDVLKLALAHPRAAEVLFRCGALDELDDEDLAAVGDAVAGIVKSGRPLRADLVMSELEDQKLHGLVSRLEAEAPRLPENHPEEQARTVACLLDRSRKQRERMLIQEDIAAAERSGDHQRVDQLLAKRRLLSNQMAPNPIGKG